MIVRNFIAKSAESISQQNEKIVRKSHSVNEKS